MNFRAIKKLFVVALILISGRVFGGGEIPWPLATQAFLSEKTSSGMWFVEVEKERLIYNVEISKKNQYWLWVRVSVLGANDLKVLAQGEGYIWNRQQDTMGLSWDSDSDADIGTYIYMDPANQEGAEDLRGYYIRLVELNNDDDKDVTLGIAVYPNGEFDDGDYGIAHQVQSQPLVCQKAESDEEDSSFRGSSFDCKMDTLQYWKYQVRKTLRNLMDR